MTEGLVLRPAQAVSTGPDAGVALRMASGHSVRLAPSSRIEVIDGATLRLAAGSAFVDSRRFGVPATAPLVVRTSHGDVTDIGTVYEVSVLASALRVRVREGRVSLGGRGAMVEARAGEEVEVSAGGDVLRTTVAPDAAAWSWASALLPPLDLDGRSLDAFLTWAAREGGWRLVYLDERVARAAPETTLSGSIAGLGLDEALGAVLATCDAAHDVRGGDLRVRSTAPPPGG